MLRIEADGVNCTLWNALLVPGAAAWISVQIKGKKRVWAYVRQTGDPEKIQPGSLPAPLTLPPVLASRDGRRGVGLRKPQFLQGH